VDRPRVRRAVDVHAHIAVAPQVVAGHQHVRAGGDQDGVEAGAGDPEAPDLDAAGAEHADADAAGQGLRADLQRLLALGVDRRAASEQPERLGDDHLLVVGAGADDHGAPRADRRDGGVDVAVPRRLARGVYSVLRRMGYIGQMGYEFTCASRGLSSPSR